MKHYVITLHRADTRKTFDVLAASTAAAMLIVMGRIDTDAPFMLSGGPAS